MGTVIIGDPIIVNIIIISPNPLKTPAGKVILQSDRETIGVKALAADASATFSIDSTTLGLGAHNFVAYYAGDDDFGASFSITLVENVVLPVTTTSFLVSNENPASLGETIIFTCTVSASESVDTGFVQFYDGYVAIDSPVNITATTPTGGIASISISSLTLGTHSISAEYVGEVQFISSTSNSIDQVIVVPVPDILIESSENPSTFADSVIFTATLSGSAGTPSGTVIFLDNASPISGSVPIISGSAAFTTSALSADDHPITVQYSGDSTYDPIESEPFTQTVDVAATTTVLISSLNPSNFGQLVQFTATVSSSAGVPDGDVEFFNGISSMAVVTLTAGVATHSISLLSPGSHNITANYLGSGNFEESLSNVVIQIINGS